MGTEVTMSDEVETGLETLPGPAAGPEETPGRAVYRLASILVGIGWLGGLGIAILALVGAYMVHQGRPEDIPLGLLEDMWPSFRDRASLSAICVAVGGLVLALVPVIVIGGMGHLLRIMVSLERGVRRLVDRLEEGRP